MPTDLSIDATLRLARDLCLGVAAFCVTPGGTVLSEISDVMPPDDAEQRVAALARSCLAHPGAHGRGLFWSAEADETGPSHPDSSLACVVAPIWSAEQWRGLLGVVDVWLPELDHEQRDGLLGLAAQLAAQLAAEPAPEPAAEPAAEPPAEPAAEPPAEPPPPWSGGMERDRAVVAPGSPAPGAGAERFVDEVLDNLPDGLLVTRADGRIVLVNRTFSTLTGLDMDAVLGEDVTAVVEPATANGVGSWEDLGTSHEGLGPVVGPVLEPLLGRADPSATLVIDGAGGPRTFRADGRRLESRFAGDCFVTLVQAVGEQAELHGSRIQQLLDHIEDGIVCTDAHGTVLIANRAARALQGLAHDQLAVGQPFPAVTALRTAQDQPVVVDDHPLQRSMREGVPIDEDLLLHEGDRLVHVAVSARPLRIEDGAGAIAVLRDVTADRERQEHLTHYALHDPLTGVANRYLLDDALGRMLDGLVRRGGSVSLVYLDLDNFKAINDEHGHEVGDEVLRAVARRLERAVRGEDVVARIGGDEFVVAHLSGERLSDGDTVVARIRKVLSAPYRFGDLALDVRASVGWVSASSGGDTPQALISRADRAMYQQKAARRTQVDRIPA
ncbi:MAG: diguanylate cyclase [Actinomycetota bacterium]|nr:diguanylate cyclase [Actinomycetota bacterium]